MTCNWMGGTHCGQAITSVENLGKRGSAHVHMADGNHEWRELAQCLDCYEKDCATAKEAIEQMDWRHRRIARDFSQGEAARALGLGTSVYSQLEALRMVAPQAVVAQFDALFPRAQSDHQSEDCPRNSSETPMKTHSANNVDFIDTQQLGGSGSGK